MMSDAERLLELAAQVDHDNPDYSGIINAVESTTNPWGTLGEVLQLVHTQFL